MSKTKLFFKKDCMNGTTKFNFMKHLPTPQPNRSRFALVFLLFMTLFLGSTEGWGQIAQRGTATTNAAALSGSSRVLTINKPTGVVAGDVMIASIVQNETDNDNGGLSANTLAGWTLIKGVSIRSEGTGNGDNAWYGTCLYRIADGTEGASFSFLMPNDRADMAIGSIVAFSGVASNAFKPDGSTGGPFDVVPGSFSNANSATATAAGVTIANNNSALVMIGMVNNDRTYSSWSNSLVELFDNITTNGDDASIGAAWTSCNLSQATGDRTVTISASDRNSAILLALRSASVVTVGSPSTSPTLCQNTALTNITHTTVGATGISGSGVSGANGLPAGVSASYSSNTITISGTPTETGTFNYSIPINPGCVRASGTITVLPRPTLVSASSNASTICAGGSVNLSSSATSNSNTATSLLNENFNSTPTGWTTTNSSVNGTASNAAWTLRPNNYNYNSGTIFSSNDASQFYLSNSDAQGSGGTSSTILQSPSFSTVGISSATLSFFHYYRDYDENDAATVEISTDGTTWISLVSYTSTQGSVNSFNSVSINLNSYLNNSNLQVRFRYNAVWGYYWAIDNVSVTGTYTTPPAATFAWTSSPAGFTSSTQNPTGVSPSATTTYTVTATNNFGCTATATTTVTLNSVTAGSIGSAQTICSGGNPAAFTSTAATGSGTITYRWESNTNLTTPSWSTVAGQTSAIYDVPSGLATTTQYRRITISTLNSVACESAATNVVQVTVNPLPSSVITAESATTFCAGGSVTLTAPAGGSTYDWRINGTIVSSGTSNSYTANQNGLFTVTVTNANTCSSTTSSAVQVSVTANNTFGAASSTPTLCINTALSNITIATTGATGISNSGVSGANGLPAGVTASWASNTITISGTPTASGTFNYSIPLTGGCGSVNATGTINVNPNVPASVSIAATATTICSGTSVTFTATPTNGGTSPSYQWKVNGTDAGTDASTFTSTSLSNNDAVTCVMTSNATPCLTGSPTTSNSIGMNVNPVLTASVSIAASATGICSGNSITFTATPTNGGSSPAYVWKKNGAIVSGQTSVTFISGSFATGDVITCEMTSNATPCLAGSPATSNAVTITVNPIVTPTFTQVAAICSGATLNALPTTSNNGITGTWSPAMNNAATTEYTYTPDAGQCASTTTMTINVTTPTLTYYVDADGDNFGVGTGTLYCTNPGAGYSDVNTDCNDANVSISPMAEELCDGIDNDCNANTTDGLGTTTYFRDLDGDTYGNPNVTTVSCQAPAGYVADNTDCDDSNADFHIINTYFADADEDSFGDAEAPHEACFLTAGYVVNAQDCDDTNAAVNPNATEICNLIDDDCDGEINDGLTSVDYHFDGDGDGFGSGTAILLCAPTAGYVQNSSDCNDNNASVYPGATEICGNTVDEDCAAGDLAPAYYTSAQSGPWASASTWNISCDNNSYTAANYAPAVGYFGIVTVDAGHTVTVEVNNGQIASTQNLNINATGTLVVNGKMSVAQTLVNNGTLTVNHGASFLQSSTTAVNSGSGEYVVNMNLTGTSNAGGAPNGRYWYIGSPMNNTNISNTFYSSTHKTRIWEYLTATNAWSPIINGTTGFGEGSATNMTVGLGYLYRAASNQSVVFTGTSSTFNNNITSPLSFTGTGYKFVANPYTSHIDWTAVTRTGLNVSYWIRNENNTNYESYNATSGVSNSPSGQTTRYIPAMQGFYVYAFTASSSLRIDNGDRVHSTNVLHAPMNNQIVRLNLNDGKSDDQAVVYENENANNGIEEFDTDKFIDENHHQVYFLEGTKQVSLDGLKDATAKQRVDMGIQITSAGTYTINAVELGVEEDVMLEDKFTHTFQDLKRNSSYSFTANAGTFNNRFVLHFTLNPQTETAMESVAVIEEETEVEGVQVYTTTGQQIKVWVSNNTDFQNATVKVYDVVGNMIERKNMTSSQLLLDLDTATGVYLVEVTGDSKVFTKKIFVTK